MPNFIEEMQRDAEKLVALLRDPHPGLSTWVEMVENRINSLKWAIHATTPVPTSEASSSECETPRR